MIRKFTSLFLFTILLSLSYVQAQNVSIALNTYGRSPQQVANSTTDIYDFQYNGLTNVGVGTKMYLIATVNGKKFGTVTYTVSRKPQGSTAAIGKTIDVQNDSTQVIVFIPDKAGTYNVTVADGSYNATIVINAAKYLGYQNTVINGVDTKLSCNTCHSDLVSSWQNTKHASMFTRAMNGTPGLSGPTDHYSKNCIGCHTTGFDADSTAKNDGFDDLTFTYPSVLAPGVFDQLKQQFPDAMMRANIQCESCHGPASGHLGNTADSRMEFTFDAAVCAYCHDSGTHHYFPRQFDYSLHAHAVNESGSGREACVRCHSGRGFQEYMDGVATTDPYFDASYAPITCQACHDPHDATNQFQLRAVSASLLGAGGTTYQVTNAGLGAICMNCHHSRTEANAAVAGAGTASITSRFGPHHGPQGDIIEGRNMLELGGQKLAMSNHIGATVDACVRCHMYDKNRFVGTQLIPSGGHTFRMSTPDGVDDMEACSQCHGFTFGTSFDQVKFYLNGVADFDNNGVEEGLQIEVKGMIAKIMAEIKLETGSTTPSKTWSKNQLSAYWNAITAQEDRSNGIHNPKYVITALLGSMKLLNIPTGVKQDFKDEVPTNYVIYQNYPNPFNPSTNIRFALPKESHVKLTIFDVTGREIQTLVNDNLAAGTHTVEWSASNLASGIYLYRIEAGSFVQVNKMILLK